MRYAFVIAIALAGIANGDDPPVVAPTEHRKPAEERAAFKVPDGFEVQLVASEPDIAKPINLAFDAKGRLWVTTSLEYPFEAPDGKGRDSVKVLSDFGPDGRARKIETFADGLNIPIGILPYKDGAIVYSIPNLWMLRDTTGNGKCDKREILFSGFGHRDTHGMVNGLFMGFDGWVYANHGYLNDSKIKGTDGHEITMNSGNVFRFKPDGSRVELFAKGQVNPFGSCMDKWGNLYTACCHSKPITLVLRGAVYESFSKPHDGLGFGPAMVHEYRGSTALCGVSWYDADYFPKQYQECFYLGDVVNNCINRFTVTWKGATPTAHQQEDFLTSSDPWFRPCDIKLGPDGALYVADFYNRIIGHYEAPLNHPGRDRTSGRIWRIVRKDKKPDTIPDRTKSTVDELITNLESPNITVRFLAMNQLAERNATFDPWITKLKTPQQYGCALHIADRTGNWSRTRLRVAMMSLDELTRVHATRIVSEFKLSAGETSWVDAVTFSDAQPHSNQCAIECLGRHSSGKLEVANLCDLYTRFRDDPFLEYSVRLALREKIANGLTLLENRPPDPKARALLAQVALGVHSHPGADEILDWVMNDSDVRPSPEQIRHVARFVDMTHWTWRLDKTIARLEQSQPKDITVQTDMAHALITGLLQRGARIPESVNKWAVRASLQALRSPDPAGIERGLRIVRELPDPKLSAAVSEIVRDRKRNDLVRAAAIPTAVAASWNDVAQCLEDPSESPALREAAARALGGVNKPEAQGALMAVLPNAPARLAAIIAGGLAGTKPGAEQLCNIVEQGKASPRLLVDPTVKPKLDAAGLKDRVAKLTEGLPPADKQIQMLIAKRREAFGKSKPDAAAGKALFTKHCAICHQVANEGTKIGPQLDGIGIRGLDRLLEDILDPNRNVDPNFRTTNLQLNDGRSLSGLFLREEGQVLVLADNLGKEFTVRKDQIESRSVSPTSAMPANVTEPLGDAEFASLMAYLLALKK